MANATAAYGFEFHSSLYPGGSGTPPTIECAVLTAAGDIFVGDAVKLSGTGDSEGRASIDAIPTAEVVVYGVVVGLKASGPDSLATQYIASADSGVAIVIPALPGYIFRVNPEGATGVALNDIGLLVDSVAGSGDTLTGRSAHEAEVGEGGGTAPATTGNSWRFIGFDRRPDNTIDSTVSTNNPNADMLVVCVESTWLGSAGV